MAKRPVYYLDSKNNVKKLDIEFQWYPGFSIKQKQNSINDLHEKVAKKLNCSKSEILEISTKSTNELGIKLSAFNLKLKLQNIESTVEAFFQSSKVFELGGPYRDLLNKSSFKVKKDSRLKNSGNLSTFVLFNESWSTEPKTYFYDWLYINALYQNSDLSKQMRKYRYFTDIEFNPKKSINCQAHSAAFYLSLKNKKILRNMIKDKNLYQERFKNRIYTQGKLL